MKYIIKSLERNLYFAAIHSYTPFYTEMDKAKEFASHDAAWEYAMDNLFTCKEAFAIEVKK